MPHSIEIYRIVNLVLLPIIVTAIVMDHINIITLTEMFESKIQTIIQ